MNTNKAAILARTTVSFEDIQMAGAFLVMGMTEKPLTDEECIRFDGQTGAAQLALTHARLVSMVEARAVALKFEGSGVYFYDVAESLGIWLRGQEYASQAAVEIQLINLASDFYGCDCACLVRPKVSQTDNEDSDSKELHEYAFDVKLQASIRVKATSAEQAKELLHETLDAANCNGGAWANGDPVMFEASTAEGFEPVLFEVDGEELSNAV